ncbi:DUF5819 family protein [Phytoactinopolyspora halotolerans]|uniref:Uncharacterized protein n=1 Tax=Phytoactinopolyspora halotolerans TaxID=1981512 RepID=A0A6L9S7H7_9ACTN|nr:DUF5819 family protein [Phytoactinopolyspora halotolerans]NEE00933.1 hypothetical protein [Phytoactinopolyspora halotolerans]
MQQTRPAWLKALAAVLGAAVTAHLAATAIFVGPDNVAKDAWDEPLDSYMEPFFQQNWSLFAPNPIDTEHHLYVRGWYDAERPTEWVDVTELEIQDAITHNLTPSRAGKVTTKLASRIGRQRAKLTNEEQKALEAHYHDDAWDRLEARMLEGDHSPSGRISYVLRYDETITAYATQFAYAWWGEDAGLQYVQFKIVEQDAAPFARRKDDSDRPTRVREFGRRPFVEFDGQDRESFAAAIERFAS